MNTHQVYILRYSSCFRTVKTLMRKGRIWPPVHVNNQQLFPSLWKKIACVHESNHDLTSRVQHSMTEVICSSSKRMFAMHTNYVLWLPLREYISHTVYSFGIPLPPAWTFWVKNYQLVGSQRDSWLKSFPVLVIFLWFTTNRSVVFSINFMYLCLQLEDH